MYPSGDNISTIGYMGLNHHHMSWKWRMGRTHVCHVLTMYRTLFGTGLTKFCGLWFLLSKEFFTKKQWNTDAQGEGICAPSIHNHSLESNQKKNFKELSEFLSEIKCLKWLKNMHCEYVPLINYLKGDTTPASYFHPDNLWHAFHLNVSHHRNMEFLQLCGCHSNRFNSDKEGCKIVLSLSCFRSNGVREGWIGYMRSGIQACEENFPLYKATNNRIYNFYAKTPPNCLIY